MKRCCDICYWYQMDGSGVHAGCYAKGKWRKWITKKSLKIPNDCTNFKEELVDEGSEL